MAGVKLRASKSTRQQPSSFNENESDNSLEGTDEVIWHCLEWRRSLKSFRSAHCSKGNLNMGKKRRRNQQVVKFSHRLNYTHSKL